VGHVNAATAAAAGSTMFPGRGAECAGRAHRHKAINYETHPGGQQEQPQAVGWMRLLVRSSILNYRAGVIQYRDNHFAACPYCTVFQELSDRNLRLQFTIINHSSQTRGMWSLLIDRMAAVYAIRNAAKIILDGLMLL
jgi:hypothetical protein